MPGERVFAVRPSGEPYKNPTFKLPALVTLDVTLGGAPKIQGKEISLHAVILDQLKTFQSNTYKYAAYEAAKNSSSFALAWRTAIGGRIWPYDTGRSSRALLRDVNTGTVRGTQEVNGSTAEFSVTPPHRRDARYMSEIERLGKDGQSRSLGHGGGTIPPTRVLRTHAREYMDENRGFTSRLATIWRDAVTNELNKR